MKSVTREEAVTGLMNAIVYRAFKDYYIATKKGDEGAKKSLMYFFKSEWYKMLTNVDYEYVIKHIEKEANNGKRLFTEYKEE